MSTVHGIPSLGTRKYLNEVVQIFLLELLVVLSGQDGLGRAVGRLLRRALDRH